MLYNIFIEHLALALIAAVAVSEVLGAVMNPSPAASAAEEAKSGSLQQPVVAVLGLIIL